MTKPGWKESLKSLVFENFGLKVVSLFCALALYIFIHSGDDGQRTFAVSVVAIMPPEVENRQLMTALPTEVSVTLRGPKAKLDDLRAGDLGSVELDLRRGRETRVELGPDKFEVPAGLKVERIWPPNIDLRWDDVVTRSVSVQVPRTGDPAKGLTIKSASADPSTVTARGPKSLVDTMQFARTEPFDVTDLPEGQHKKDLSLDRPHKGISFSAEIIHATLDVGRAETSKVFNNVKVEIIGMPRASTNPATVSVTVTGTEEELAAVSAEAIVARVEPKVATADLKTPGSAFLDVLVELPKVKATSTPAKVVVKW